jgi:hypothetical protein
VPDSKLEDYKTRKKTDIRMKLLKRIGLLCGIRRVDIMMRSDKTVVKKQKGRPAQLLLGQNFLKK